MAKLEQPTFSLEVPAGWEVRHEEDERRAHQPAKNDGEGGQAARFQVTAQVIATLIHP